MGYFRIGRNIELSTQAFLETQINANWSGITVVKGFSQAYKASLPVIAVRIISADHNRLELGDNTLLSNYKIGIDIFAKSEGQRIDLASFIIDTLKSSWDYKEYSQSSGNPELLTSSTTGKILCVRFTEDNRLDFGEDVDTYDLHRHFISLDVRKS